MSSVTLTKSEIIKYNPGNDIPAPAPAIPKADGNLAKTLVMALMVVLAIAIFFGISFFDEDQMGIAAIIAVIVAAVGLLGAGVIVDIITGNFHLSLWPFIIGGGG